MKLDDAQKQKVTQWIEEGLKLSEIQDRLAKEFGLRLTYMEVRFLMDDLGVKIKDKAVEAPAQVGAAKPGQPGAKPAAAPADEPGSPGQVSVTVDQITRPGAMASGKVKFSDGKSADWYVDQMGRLGLVPKEQGYKPPEEDLMEFQMELQNELAKLGF